MDYHQAMEYLDSFQNYERVTGYNYEEVFSLDRVRQLLKRLGNPERRYPTLHVAGTKGKGSTCVFAASILQAAGLRVGLYTSPHLISFRERFQINGQPISEEALAEIVSKIKPVAQPELTFFEVTTAAAFLYFAQEKVDVAVVEVGLGGRLDATNLVQPAVTAITPISLDHTAQLGTDLVGIAREKAGIIKPGVPVVIGPQPSSEITAVFEEAAARVHAPLHLLEQELQIRSVRNGIHGSRCTVQTPERTYPELTIPLLGRHQIWNAAAAVRMVELAMPMLDPRFRWDDIDAAVSTGLAQTVWSGRCQLVEGPPPILLDGAHNAASAEVLRRTVEEFFPEKPVWLVFGTAADKDLEGMAAVFGPWAKKLTITQARNPRAASPEKIAQVFNRRQEQTVLTGSVPEALAQAISCAKAEDLIVVSGSLFVVGEALQELSRRAPTALAR